VATERHVSASDAERDFRPTASLSFENDRMDG